MTEKEALKKLDEALKDMTSTTMGRRMFLASASLMLASCATPEQHRTREGDNSGQEAGLTVEDEKKMTELINKRH